MLNTFEKIFTKSEIPISSSGKKNYDTNELKPGFFSALRVERKVLAAAITLLVCIIILVAAKSFGG